MKKKILILLAVFTIIFNITQSQNHLGKSEDIPPAPSIFQNLN